MRFLAATVTFLVVCTIATWQFFLLDTQQHRQYATLEDGTTRSFVVPQNDHLADPSAAALWIPQLAEKHGINVFRTSLTVDTSSKLVARHYIHLSRPTLLFDDWSLSAGRFPQVDDSKSASFILATPESELSGDYASIGTLRDIGMPDDVAVLPLSSGIDRYSAVGAYSLEGPLPDITAFNADFLQKANDWLQSKGAEPLSLIDLRPDETAPQYSDQHIAPRYAAITVLSVTLIGVVVMVYVISRRAGRIGAMRLHGAHPVRIWYGTIGRVLIISTALATVLSGGVLAVLAGLSPLEFGTALVWCVASSLALLTASAMYVSVASMLCLKNSLKGSQPTKIPLRVSAALRIIVTSAVIIGCINVGAGLADSAEEAKKLSGWSHSEDLAVLYPQVLGEEANHDQGRHNVPRNGEIYQAFLEQDVIYADAGQFHPDILPLYPEGIDPFFHVNPGYLERFPVLNTDGSAISVDEETTEAVIIIPESRTQDRDDLLHRFSQDVVYGRNSGLSESENAQAVQEMTENVVVIESQSEQDVFTINPDAPGTPESTLRDPVIVVRTAGNLPDDMQLAPFSTGAAGEDSLKIPVDRQSPGEVYQQMLPALQELNIADNFPALVSLSTASTADANDARKQVYYWAALTVMFIGLLVFLTINNTAIFVAHFQRRTAIRKLMGASVLSTHAELAKNVVFSWIAITLLSVVLYILTPIIFDFSTTMQPTALSISTILGIVFFEAILVYVAAAILENRSIVSELKNT